jgi:protein-S-isoprenylcysteine O-methyltransferase Ste14
MPVVPAGWFPNSTFANVFAIIVIVALLSDEVVPRLRAGRGISWRQARDRGSSLGIQVAGFFGCLLALLLRSRTIGVVPPWIQVLAIPLLIFGTLFREWAIFLLGRFFSRSVRIEQGHRLIQEGPYRWIRHPAYTGMLIMDTAIVLGLGTWAGAAFMLVIVLSATLYRIQVEEKALVEAFGDEYRVYMRRTWRLLPGW